MTILHLHGRTLRLHIHDPRPQIHVHGDRLHLDLGGPPAGLPAGDPFAELLRGAEGNMARYKEWRELLRRCAGPVAASIAREYEARLGVGEFPGLSIDPERLRAALEAPVAPFDAETFDRYAGSARGVFRTYDLSGARELGTFTLLSVWDPENFRQPDGRIGKRITGSFGSYVDPRALPPLESGTVDPILNSWHPEVGVASWVEVYQGVRMTRAAVAYKLPHPHEILWFVKDLALNGEPVHNNVFMASHEWKGTAGGKTQYYMVGLFFEIDAASCTARLSGDTFWRALYDEEPRKGLST